MVGVAGLSSVGASLFAPFPRLNWLNVCVQVLPVYVWSVYALPRYGWLLEAFIVIHAVAIVQTDPDERRTSPRDVHRSVDAGGARRRPAAGTGRGGQGGVGEDALPGQHEPRDPDAAEWHHGARRGFGSLALTGEQRAVLDDIGRSGHHLLSIVNDILDMAKVTSGKLSLEQVPFDLPALIRDLASPAAALAEAAATPLPSASAAGFAPPDTGRSAAHTPGGLESAQQCGRSSRHPEKSVSPCKCLVQAGFGSQVSDTGIGLSPEQQDGLFQEFHQVDSSTDTQIWRQRTRPGDFPSIGRVNGRAAVGGEPPG